MERALTLDVNRLVRDRVLAPGKRTRSTICWTYVTTGQRASSVSYEADMTDPRRSWLRLRYATPDPRTGLRREVDQRVPLTATRPHLGGLRWWFLDDGRRVGRMHLPPGGDLFRSRRTYRLVYASQYKARQKAASTSKVGGVGPTYGHDKEDPDLTNRVGLRLCRRGSI